MKVIDSFAFSSCTALTQIEIPKSITTINESKIREYIDEIVRHGNSKDMDCLRDMLAKMICEYKETDPEKDFRGAIFIWIARPCQNLRTCSHWFRKRLSEK